MATTTTTKPTFKLSVPADYSIAFTAAVGKELEGDGAWVAGHGADHTAPEERMAERNPELILGDFNGALGCMIETAAIASQLPGREEMPRPFDVEGELGALREIVQQLILAVYVPALATRVLHVSPIEAETLVASKALVGGLAWALDRFAEIEAADNAGQNAGGS